MRVEERTSLRVVLAAQSSEVRRGGDPTGEMLRVGMRRMGRQAREYPSREYPLREFPLRG